MKGITINKGSSEIVINLDKLKYTSTSSVNFGKVMLHGLSSEDITSIENALESTEKHSAAIEVGGRTINLDSITHLDADTIYYSDGPHISSVTPSDMEAIEDALEAYSPGPGPVPPTPSNLKFDPLHWTDVTSEWTLPTAIASYVFGYMNERIWTDNQGNYYYGYLNTSPTYKIDFENKSITEMTGWTQRSGSQFWTIGDTIMYNMEVWNPNNTTSPVTWMGEYPSSWSYIWTDGEHIYWTDSNGASGVLTSFGYTPGIGYMGTWESVTFTYTPSSFGTDYLWTDGENVYYSSSSTNQYVLDKANREWQISVIDFNGYSLSRPKRQLFTDGADIYMNSTAINSTANRLLKYDKAMMTFSEVAYPYTQRTLQMFSKFLVNPTCQPKGLPLALGRINPNTNDIYNITPEHYLEVMDKIEVE